MGERYYGSTPSSGSGNGKEARQGHARVGATPGYLKDKRWKIRYATCWSLCSPREMEEKAGFRERQADRRINIPLAQLRQQVKGKYVRLRGTGSGVFSRGTLSCRLISTMYFHASTADGGWGYLTPP